MRGDGDNKVRSPGRSRISRKTIAQGRPVVRLVPVVLPRAFLLHADHGCERHPAFPAPSSSNEGGLLAKLGHIAPRECFLMPHSLSCSRVRASSTPRPLGSSTAASGILDRPLKRAMTTQGLFDKGPSDTGLFYNRVGIRSARPHAGSFLGAGSPQRPWPRQA
jgi:hypothetical protein